MKIIKTGKRSVVTRDERVVVVEKQVPKTLVWIVALWAALTLGLMAGGCASAPSGPVDTQTLLECQQLLKECSESLIDCESM